MQSGHLSSTMCSSFEGIPPLVDRWVRCTPVGLGVKGAGSKICEVGACSATPNNRGELFSFGQSRTVVLLLKSAASALGIPPMPAPARSTEKGRLGGGGGLLTESPSLQLDTHTGTHAVQRLSHCPLRPMQLRMPCPFRPFVSVVLVAT